MIVNYASSGVNKLKASLNDDARVAIYNHQMFIVQATRGCTHSTTFYLYVINWPNRLDCYITLGWKVFPGTNTLAYWAHSYKKKCCEYNPKIISGANSFW